MVYLLPLACSPPPAYPLRWRRATIGSHAPPRLLQRVYAEPPGNLPAPCRAARHKPLLSLTV